MDERELFALVRKNYGEANREYLKQQVMAAVSHMKLPSRKETTDGLLDWIVEGCVGMNDRYRPFIYSSLALLKGEEPRVLSREEVKKSGSAYRCVELYSPQVGRLALVYCIVRQSEFNPEYYHLLEDSGVRWCRTEEEYNRDIWQGTVSGWRCWTSRPTDEQRRAVPWNV